jgi:hypothetical protein
MSSLFIFYLALASSLVVESFSSEARLSRSGEIFYTERHEEKYSKDGRILEGKTIYRSADGQPMAELLSDYRQSVSLPSYQFVDFRTGYSDGISRLGENEILIQVTESRMAQTKARMTEEQDDFVAGQGFHHLILKSLEQFADGESKSVQLIIPARLEFYSFRIRPLGKPEGNRLSLALESKNWFIRLFAPSIRLVYDTQQKRLLEYEGPSNLKDKSGSNPAVRIVYSYAS